MRRQQVLEADNQPRYRVLPDEAVLHHYTGSPAAMAAQLDKVLESCCRTKMTIQIVPFDVGIPAAQDRNLVLLEFGDNTNI